MVSSVILSTFDVCEFAPSALLPVIPHEPLNIPEVMPIPLPAREADILVAMKAGDGAPISHPQKPKKKRGRPKKTAEELEVTSIKREARRAETARNRVPCPCCTKTYASSGGLRQHMDKHHPEPGSVAKYVCGFCDIIHACRSNLKRHELSCKKNPSAIAAGSVECEFKCDVCGYGFKQKGNMLTHRLKLHPDSPTSAAAACCSQGTMRSVTETQ